MFAGRVLETRGLNAVCEHICPLRLRIGEID